MKLVWSGAYVERALLPAAFEVAFDFAGVVKQSDAYWSSVSPVILCALCV